jgi:3-isopropylmalate/(R)-2-methylmalate dehydratase large subunit
VGKTVIEKILGSHTGDNDAAGGRIVWIDLDVRSARDFGGANVVKNFEREYPGEKVLDAGATFFTFDCNAPANTIPYANNQQVCRDFAREQGIRVFDVDAGIGSHVLIEQGLCLPGTTVVGTDSHMNILGAIGAFGQGMGDQDIAYAFRWGRTWFEVPPSMRVRLAGKPGPIASAKDLTLAVLRKLGSSGGLGRAIEFSGKAVDALDLAGRITLASMATEMGAVAGLIVPDERIEAYCRDRSGGKGFTVHRPDDDAAYVEDVEVDVEGLGPMTARPGSPADVVPVSDAAGREINSVFIGSCTNGRFEDFAAAARVLEGRRIKEGVMMRLAPATREVFGRMLDEGLVETFYRAGAIMSHQGCGGCASGQLGMTGRGEVQVSTSNRNFTGKQGDGDTYLASPETAAASAVAGRLTAAGDL